MGKKHLQYHINIISLLLFVFLQVSCAKQEFSVANYDLAEKTIPPGLSTNANISANSLQDITLAAGDTLTIEVWGVEELTKQATINPAGFLYYPFIGKVKAAGLTVDQLRNTITAKISRYYIEPKVTVMPLEMAGQQYYILGEVNQPGKSTMTSRLTIMEAVAAAGGLNQDADDVVMLLRKQDKQLSIMTIPLQFDDVSLENIYSVTMRIQANDVLYLPPSKIANVERFMIRLNNILNPLLALERGILYWPSLVEAIEGSSGEITIPIQ